MTAERPTETAALDAGIEANQRRLAAAIQPSYDFKREAGFEGNWREIVGSQPEPISLVEHSAA